MKIALFMVFSLVSMLVLAHEQTGTQNNFNHRDRHQHQQCGVLEEVEAFTKQKDVDDFSVKCVGCTQYLGSIYLGSGVSNVNGLSQLKVINGFLTAWETQLTDFRGLEKLTKVGEYIGLKDNEQLVSVDGLEQLVDTQAVILISNHKLENIRALRLKSNSVSNIEVYGNSSLQDLSPLSIAAKKNDYLYYAIKNNGNVSTIGSMAAEAGQLNGVIVIDNEKSMIDTNFLENVNQVDGELKLTNLDHLSSLTGLKNITDISGTVTIDNDAGLKSLDGVQNISSSFSGHLVISNNSGLEDCQALCALTQTKNHVSIRGNNSGCSRSITQCE